MKYYSFLKKSLFIVFPFILFPALYFLGKFVFKSFPMPGCFTYQLMGIICPGCGMTRAVFALLNGDILLSLRQNAIIIPSVIIAIILYVEILLRLFDKKLPFTLFKDKYLWIYLITISVYTIARNFIPYIAPIPV